MQTDLYLNKINFARYWPAGAPVSWPEFEAKLKTGQSRLEDGAFLTPRQKAAFKLVLEADRYLPVLPLVTVPQPIEMGLIPVNEPGPDALVLVTVNNRLTFEVLTAVWAQGTVPAFFLLVDCLGNTVDMAMVYREFTVERLSQAIADSGLGEKVNHRRLMIPGFTGPLADELESATGWRIEVGPMCAAELPLFLGSRWK